MPEDDRVGLTKVLDHLRLTHIYACKDAACAVPASQGLNPDTNSSDGLLKEEEFYGEG